MEFILPKTLGPNYNNFVRLQSRLFFWYNLVMILTLIQSILETKILSL